MVQPLGRKLRIAHVLGALDYGGLQLRVRQMIERLPAFSHVVIFHAVDKGPLYTRFCATTEVIHCPYRRGHPLAFLLRITKVLRQQAPDVVLAHLFGNHALVSWAAFFAGVPATYGVSANDPVAYARSRWKPMLLAHAARPVCKGEVAVSEAVARVLRKRLLLPTGRVTAIPSGCDVETLAARAEAARGGARLAPAGAAQLLMAARMANSRDHATAFQAIDLLRREGCRVEFLLAGDGRRREAVESQARLAGVHDVVRFLGNRDDVPELMATSDVLIHSANNEGFPGVLLEAMACGVPIVTTDIPACREALNGGECGLLVPRKDPAALAEAIRRLLGDSDLRERLVAAAARRVRSLYTIERMASDYAKLLLRHAKS